MKPQVLIVGAGPTGLVFALELARRQVPFRLIEAREGAQAYSRAMGIQPRTLEVLDKMDIIFPFLKEGKKGEEFTYHWKDNRITFSFNEIDSPYPFTLLIPQSDTEAILRQRLEELGGSVEWKTRLLKIDGQTATLELPSAEQERDEFSWIIGCDGAHSKVRHAARIPFRGTKLSETFLLADITARTPFAFEGPHVFLSKMGFGLLIPFPKMNTFRLVLPGLHEAQDPEELTTLIRERGFTDPFEVTEIEMLSSFQIQRRHAATFRRKHIFLAGDAAHIHSPFGGQGMNTSIQDAYNLAWKLALVIQGASSESILDTFEVERLAVAKMVLHETTLMTRLLTFSQKRFPPLFFWALRFVLSNKKRRLKMEKKISELSIRYPKNSLIHELPEDKDWSGPKAGERAPDAPLNKDERVFDLLKSPRFVLLLFSEVPSLEEAIKKEYADWIDIKVIKGDEARKKYAAETKSVYLIRPDGYIGFRSRRFNIEEVNSYLDRVFNPASKHNKS